MRNIKPFDHIISDEHGLEYQKIPEIKYLLRQD